MTEPLAPIETRVAHVGHDELRFRGHRVFAELLGTTTFAQLTALALSGTLVGPDDAAMLDGIFAAMSSADPRLWPFKLTRLASSFGSAAIGVSATLVGSEGGMYGAARMRAAASWLLEVHGKGPLDDGQLAAELDRGGAGFGVLYRRRDERYEALMKLVVQRDRHARPYTSLCQRVARLARTRQSEPHVFLGVAAVALDCGLDVEAVAALATTILFYDAIANGVEGATQRSAALQQLPQTTIAYRGIGPRVSERASQALV